MCNLLHYQLIKAPVDGWFKLLNQEEGEFYGVPVSDNITEDIQELKSKMHVRFLCEQFSLGESKVKNLFLQFVVWVVKLLVQSSFMVAVDGPFPVKDSAANTAVKKKK